MNVPRGPDKTLMNSGVKPKSLSMPGGGEAIIPLGVPYFSKI